MRPCSVQAVYAEVGAQMEAAAGKCSCQAFWARTFWASTQLSTDLQKRQTNCQAVCAALRYSKLKRPQPRQRSRLKSPATGVL